jgi:hypothetical protein
LLGVAGGELLIPTLILLFGFDVKLAGSVSRGQPAYHAGRLCPLQPRPQLLCCWQRPLRCSHGHRLGGRHLHSARLLRDRARSVLLALILLLSAVKLWRHRRF